MKNKLLMVFILALLIPAIVFGQSAAGGRRRGPTMFTLTVNANVSGYQVSIDGRGIKGNSMELEAGTHNVQVRANGYFDWQQTVNLTGNRTVYANLQPMTYRLTINSNIKGARVFINGNPQGMTSFVDNMRPGSYSIRVSEFGYQDFNTTVQLNSDQEVFANLQPAYAGVHVKFPANLLNSKDKGAAGKVELYVDGNRQNGHSFQLMPGQHRIQVISGGFSVEQEFNFQPGRDYTIEPSLGLSIN